jgi:hypothetical protein
LPEISGQIFFQGVETYILHKIGCICTDFYSIYVSTPAMANPHAALEALQCGPSTDSEKRYFEAKHGA